MMTKSINTVLVPRSLLLGVLLVGGVFPILNAGAAQNKSSADTIAKSQYLRAEWAAQLQMQLQSHPRWQRLMQLDQAATAEVSAAAQPLYNPELELSYDEKSDASWQAGFRQQIDLYDKRSVAQTIASSDQALSRLARTLEQNALLAQSLNGLIEQGRARQQLQLARLQLELTDRLVELTATRVQAGDLNEVDQQLVQLSRNDALFTVSQARQQLQQAGAEVRNLLGARQIELPEQLISAIPEQPGFAALNQQLPRVQLAQLQAQRSRQQVEQARLNRKADPTIGFGLGEDGDEQVITLSLSVPLNIRNSYGAEVEAAEARSLAEDQSLQNSLLRNRNALESRWQQLESRWQMLTRWPGRQSGSQSGLERQLEKQWRLGDLTTTAYLQGLQQRNEMLSASIELQAQLDRSWIAWLDTSNGLQAWFARQ